MNAVIDEIPIEHDAEISTWFRTGGRAKRLARPESVAQLSACIELDPELLMLGSGANLLVADSGVDNLVVSIQREAFSEVRIDKTTGRVYAGAGASLPRLITQTIKEGLGGLEGVTGIPATVGGATIMNAGGAFGSIGTFIETVYAIDRAGREHEIPRSRLSFDYRKSGLNHLIITGVEFALTPGDPEALKERLGECMEYKKQSQPMRDRSAGCAFKNPILETPVPSLGITGAGRVSAGLLIDRAGCKGMSVGQAKSSEQHANFLVTGAEATARDVLTLMAQIEKRVFEEFGVHLERELVVWGEDAA